MTDPYEVLGVPKTATPEEIRKAYRQLAKKLPSGFESRRHERRGAVQGCFRRQRYALRRGEAPPIRRGRNRRLRRREGAAQRPLLSRICWRWLGPNPYENAGGYADYEEGDDLFAELLRRSREQARRAPGGDLRYELAVPFLDAVNGATKTITLPQGGTLEVKIPPGVEDGQTMRLKGKGAPSRGEGPPGDALVQIAVQPHRYFTREGDNIHVELPITLKEAALGGEVRAPTTTGGVMLEAQFPNTRARAMCSRTQGKGVKQSRAPATSWLN